MGRPYIASVLPPSEKITTRGSFTLFLRLPPPHVALEKPWARVAIFFHVDVALDALGNQDRDLRSEFLLASGLKKFLLKVSVNPKPRPCRASHAG
jgi:hypothetical protein